MGQFKNLFMRPNLLNSGTIPAKSPLSDCPDIWISGDKPVLDYKTSLITDESYKKESRELLVINKDNYIYVRGKNGDEKDRHAFVSLFYADGAVIQWPSMWVDNQLKTDLNEKEGKILELPSNSIGVVERPFVWKKVAPYKGTCHYCLIAQFNDENNSNPLPDVRCSIDMAQMVSNNLRFGWRNITNSIVKDVVMSYNTNLVVPVDIADESRTYLLFLDVFNIPKGCMVSFECSQPDADGLRIGMDPFEVTGDGQIVGCKRRLEPGFSGLITVYLHNPKNLPIPPNAKLTFEADYYASMNELIKHNAMHLLDTSYTERIFNHLRLNDNSVDAAILRLGAYSGTFKY